MGFALDHARFDRSQVFLWNVVPYCISSATQNRNATASQIREAAVDTQSFVDRLSQLCVTVFCGRSAQRAIKMLRFPEHVRVLQTFHPGARSFNLKGNREHLLATFKEARRLVV